MFIVKLVLSNYLSKLILAVEQILLPRLGITTLSRLVTHCSYEASQLYSVDDFSDRWDHRKDWHSQTPLAMPDDARLRKDGVI